MSNTNCVIVSRHPAAIEFLHSMGISEDVPVIAQATTADVAGKVVYGNLPMNLAAAAYSVTVIEFAGNPPRGQEYTLEDMIAAGAHLASYTVFSGAPMARLNEEQGYL